MNVTTKKIGGRPRIGVDVGGTFTDVILVDGSVGRTVALKLPTTPQDPSIAVVEGIHAVLAQSGVKEADVEFIGHGTTIATNLLVEGKGARVALLTTRGFRDVLEIRRSSRHDRADLYDMFFENPPPLVRRGLRREVDERLLYTGEVARPLDEAQVAAECDWLKAQGVEAVAICLLHAHQNDEHEQRVAEIVRERMGEDVFVTASSKVNPEIFEYERTSTTAVNALLGPRCAEYLSTLEGRVAAEGFVSGVHLMQSNGGLTRPGEAAQRPVTLLMSGPAGGVTAAAKMCRRIGVANAITGDVGGTTFDVSLIRNYEPEVRTVSEIGTYTVRAPTTDIISIGAGGGSIAHVDAAGGIAVGPRSAGANPGPACYGRGGTLPTVTDCNLVLGYVSAHRPMGATILDMDKAVQAIEEHLAKPLGLSVPEAARTVRAIANASMVQAMRLVTIERGYDPREFAYVAFGGAGPVHAIDVAEQLEVHTVIIPPYPGLFSAFGMLVADTVHDFQQPLMRNAEDIGNAELEKVFRVLEGEALARMRASDIAPERVKLIRRVDCRYLSQAESITIDLPEKIQGPMNAAIRDTFIQEHQRAWNFSPKRPVLVTNLRVRAVVPTMSDNGSTAGLDSSKPEPRGRRRVMIGDSFQDLPCYEREDLAPSHSFVGPLVIEEPSSSLVLKAGQRARVDEDGNLIVSLGSDQQ